MLEQVYNIKSIETAKIIQSLIKTPGIKLTGGSNIESVMKYWPLKISDYGDAVLAYYAKTSNVPIITFDKKLIKQLIKENIPCKKID